MARNKRILFIDDGIDYDDSIIMMCEKLPLSVDLSPDYRHIDNPDKYDLILFDYKDPDFNVHDDTFFPPVYFNVEFSVDKNKMAIISIHDKKLLKTDYPIIKKTDENTLLEFLIDKFKFDPIKYRRPKIKGLVYASVSPQGLEKEASILVNTHFEDPADYRLSGECSKIIQDENRHLMKVYSDSKLVCTLETWKRVYYE